MQSKTNTIKLKFYADSAHGWAAVKRQLLADLGIIDKITQYSYQKGATVYLEEDCDLGILRSALALKGVMVEFVTGREYSDRASPIRNYDRFQA